MRRVSRVAVCAAVLVACGGGGGGGGGSSCPAPRKLAGAARSALRAAASDFTCSEEERKSAVLDTVQSWYLNQALLPALDPADYASAEALLAALTAPAVAAGLDKAGFDFIWSEAEYQQFMEEGQAVDYGFNLVSYVDDQDRVVHLVVRQVYGDSAAGRAGFIRGDEIVSIGTAAGTLQDVAGHTLDEVGAMLDSGGQGGFTRVFRVLPRGGGAEAIRSVTTGTFDVDPVPAYWVSGTTGYVQLRTFIQPADAALRCVFGRFRDAGVQDVIVDLRYNGGGAVDTAVVLANLLAGDLAGQVMFTLQHNAAHAEDDVTIAFSPEAEAGTFRRIAFITTHGSASASELVPNSLDPYRSPTTQAYVGGTTYGKPVGQYAFAVQACSMRLFVISFRLANSAGDGGYFAGLPDANSQAPLCAVQDDLSRDQDDPAEGMTGAARYFVEHGSCAPAAAVRASPAWREGAFAGRARTPARYYMPGTF